MQADEVDGLLQLLARQVVGFEGSCREQLAAVEALYKEVRGQASWMRIVDLQWGLRMQKCGRSQEGQSRAVLGSRIGLIGDQVWVFESEGKSRGNVTVAFTAKLKSSPLFSTQI